LIAARPRRGVEITDSDMPQMSVIHPMDLKRLVWQHRFRCTVLLDRGGDPERFRDEARGLGRVALLVQFCAVPIFLKKTLV